MWSLPDINRLNEEAVKTYEQDKNKTPKQILRGQKCEFYHSSGKEPRATAYYDYYDPFSDVPKGKIFLCKEHDEGEPEGYFTCARCDKLFIDNYTWELYKVQTDDGYVCINCAFDVEIDNPENWIHSVKEITWDRVQHFKHLIPVEGKHWEKRLDFVGNVEFDSWSGKSLRGGDGVAQLKDLVRKAKKPCILILDAGYQFAVSIGVYVNKAEEKKVANG